MKSKILVIEDDPSILQMIKHLFESEGMEVFSDESGDSAERIVAAQQPNAAIIDITLPGRSGLEILSSIKKIDPGLAIIMMSGHSNTQYAIEAMKSGAYDYLTKPLELVRLKAVVDKALECNLLSRKVRYTKAVELEKIDDASSDLMIGSSPEMIEIWKMVGKVAQTDATVLIQGESGTGKELLARAIYNNSKRMNRPFMAVNCAAIPENLLESELFGHEKGAFTDAHSRRIGKFEQCNGATLFLDEIGEMSLANQGKLLRVLESQTFERVGGNETIKVDVRIIAATNKSLVAAVKDKSFRIDLFYRLRVVNFFLPALRDRIEDIPLLVNYFTGLFGKKYGKRNSGLAPEAMDMLLRQKWEGNIRELKNVIDSATVMSKSDMLMVDDLFPFLQTRTDSQSPDTSVKNTDNYYAIFRTMLEPVFDRICLKDKGTVFENVNTGLERALVEMAMEKGNNNQVLVSKLLGISRNTLRDRIEKFNLSS
ncbi:MAG: sigma-54-dependent Fis family transcriptional regulator [Geobacteraceae bacterium]|nr:sigma-54-dependent Fis family transcriptional regulator [Geobacteraceae bacterium]